MDSLCKKEFLYTRNVMCAYFKITEKGISAKRHVSQIEFYSTSMGEGNGTRLQYCCPENPMDGGASQTAVHGVTKSEA